MSEDVVRFSCMNESDPGAAMVMRHNKELVEYMVNMPVVLEEDLRAYCARQRASLGVSAHAVKQMLNVSVMLARMPKLAKLALDLGHLDLGRLVSIEKQISGVSDSKIEELEERLVDQLTPKIHDQVLPQKRTIGNYARELVAKLEPDSMVRKRDHKTEKASIRIDDDGSYHLAATFDPVNGAKLYTAMRQRAGKKVNPETLYGGLVKLLDERIITHVRLNALTDPQGTDSVYLIGAGWLSPEDAEQVLGAVTSEHEISGRELTTNYKIPQSLSTYVRARDGHCRFPGCSVEARFCQIDHVIPHSQGGLTIAFNLQCLCQHHHTLKTEGVVHVDIDDAGVCTWTLNDGSVHRTFPEGPWAAAPARSAAAQASSVRGHTIAHDIERRRQKGVKNSR